MIRDCFKCKRWQRCSGLEWYSFGMIRWCPWQVLWIIYHRISLGVGQWPIDQKPEGEKRRGKPKAEAYYVKAVLVLAEVMNRIEMAGDDGLALLKEGDKGADISSLSDPAYNALLYVKGKKRKRQSYLEWDRRRTARLMRGLSPENEAVKLTS